MTRSDFWKGVEEHFRGALSTQRGRGGQEDSDSPGATRRSRRPGRLCVRRSSFSSFLAAVLGLSALRDALELPWLGLGGSRRCDRVRGLRPRQAEEGDVDRAARGACGRARGPPGGQRRPGLRHPPARSVRGSLVHVPLVAGLWLAFVGSPMPPTGNHQRARWPRLRSVVFAIALAAGFVIGLPVYIGNRDEDSKKVEPLEAVKSELDIFIVADRPGRDLGAFTRDNRLSVPSTCTTGGVRRPQHRALDARRRHQRACSR